jgi:hypothetical protein
MSARTFTVLALLVALAAGCQQPQEHPAKDNSACEPDKRAVVDPALLAYLSKARAVHLQADMAETDGKPEEAIAQLERLVRAPAPGPVGDPSPEVREVLGDTYARLAELRSARADYDGAKADVRRGLDLATERTHFRGRLFEVLGAVEKRLYDELRGKGDADGARAAKQRSVAALTEAVAIQEEVINRALGAEK